MPLTSQFLSVGAVLGLSLMASTASAATLTAQKIVPGIPTQEYKNIEEFKQQYNQPTSKTITAEQSGYVTGNSVSFNKFDTTLGTLTSIDFTVVFSDMDAIAEFRTECSTSILFETTTNCTKTIDRDSRVDFGVNFLNLPKSVPVQAPSVNEQADFLVSKTYNTTTRTTGYDYFDNVTGGLTETISDSRMDYFTGTGTFDVKSVIFWFENAELTCQGDKNFLGIRADVYRCKTSSFMDLYLGSANITMTYNYDPAVVVTPPPPVSAVPLPAGLPLIMGGLAALGLAGRRRKH